MSGTRYFKLTDSTMIDAINTFLAARDKKIQMAKKFADEKGLGEPVFIRYHLFDSRLDGFEISTPKYHRELNDTGLWTKPRDGRTRPRANKKSPIYNEWQTLVSETKNDDDELHATLGWKPLDFFPTNPGFHINEAHGIYIFLMPVSCNELPGCEEISNIEYFQIKDKAA